MSIRGLLIIALFPLSLSAQSLNDAVKKGDTATVLELLKQGSDPNLQVNGISPLYIACFWGDSAMVNLLLDNGASAINPCASVGRTPLMIACAYYSGLTICKMLLEKGADVDAISESGKTALMYAARCGKKDIVEYLLQLGVDPKKKDIGGFTALDFAEQMDMSVIDMLKVRNYDVDCEAVVIKLKKLMQP